MTKRIREPIAITGMACRVPGAENPTEFWALLAGEKCAITEYPESRLGISGIFDQDPSKPGKTNIRQGGVLKQVDQVDWRSLGLSPREAMYLDPQHRMLLELSWEAIEDSGIPFERISGTRTAVFVGLLWNDYYILQAQNPNIIDGYTATGGNWGVAAHRISFKFNLTGPSFSLDNGCASSLTAVHCACNSIWQGEAEMALAGGLNLILGPQQLLAMSKGGILSPSGRCRVFDSAADGTVLSEGGGMVLLKPLSRALCDEDDIYGLVLSTSLNHNGRGEWMMAPNVDAQVRLMTQAYSDAGIKGEQIDYLELHGTGTVKGDPIEAQAVGKVVGQGRQVPCPVGSVKSNIGHLIGGASIASVIKVALAFRNRQLPASLNFRTLNPSIDARKLGIRLQTHSQDWPERERPKLAGINALSLAGGNAHAVLQEFKPPIGQKEKAPSWRSHLLPLSAVVQDSLRLRARSLAEHLKATQPGPEELFQIAYTLSARRTHHPIRRAVLGDSWPELVKALESLAGGVSENKPQPSRPCVFVFSGQGSQYVEMGRGLFSNLTPFRARILECDAIIRRELGWSLSKQLLDEQDPEWLTHTDFAQPVIFSIQYALAKLLIDLGIAPQRVVGHSVGEIAAACVVGILTLEQAVRLAGIRGKLMEGFLDLGGMLQVTADPGHVAELLKEFSGDLVIAAYNSPSQQVVSGETKALEEFRARLTERNIAAKRLPVRFGFHHPMFGKLRAEFCSAIRGISPVNTGVEFVSTLTGKAKQGSELDAEYWFEEMVNPVRFESAIQYSVESSPGDFVEIGPAPVLLGYLQEIAGGEGGEAWVTHVLNQKGGELRRFQQFLMAYFERGRTIDFSPLFAGYAKLNRHLYLDFWSRQRMWLPEVKIPKGLPSEEPDQPRELEIAGETDKRVWEVSVRLDDRRYYGEHVYQETPVMTSCLYWSMATTLAARNARGSTIELSDVHCERALVISRQARSVLQFHLLSSGGPAGSRYVVYRRQRGWTPMAGGFARVLPEARALFEPNSDIFGGEFSSARLIDGEEFYASLKQRGMDYRGSFRRVKRIRVADRHAVADFELTPGGTPEQIAWDLHPALIDACGHACLAFVMNQDWRGFMPPKAKLVRVHDPQRAVTSVRIHLLQPYSDSERQILVDVVALDSEGHPVIEFKELGLEFREKLEAQDREPADLAYQVKWSPKSTGNPLPTGRPLWLIAENDSIGKGWLEALRENGRTVRWLAPGKDKKQFLDELNRLRNEDREPVLLHLLSLGRRGELGKFMLRNLASLVSLYQWAARENVKCRIWALTAQTQAVARNGEKCAGFAQAPAWGFIRTMSQELANQCGGVVDLDGLGEAPENKARLLEILNHDPAEKQWAIRNGQGYVARLTRLDVPETYSDSGQIRGRSYLITGGTGGIGLSLAKFLADQGAARIVLASRKARQAITENPEKKKRLDVITALGTEIVLKDADVADLKSVKEIAGLFAPDVRVGVFHCAGLADIIDFQTLDEPRLSTMLGAKALGAWNLHQALPAAQLEFVVHFSSISTLVASPKIGHYAAANAFLDSFVTYQRTQGIRSYAVDWGAWREVGMGVDQGIVKQEEMAALGSLTDREAFRALAAFLDGGGDRALEVARIALVPIHWHVIQSRYAKMLRDGFYEEFRGAQPTREQELPDAISLREKLQSRGTSVSLSDFTIEAVQLIAGVVGISPSELDLDKSLIENGLDSLLGMFLKERIEKELSLNFSVVKLMSSQTVRDVVAELYSEFQGGAVTQDAQAVLDSLDDLSPEAVEAMIRKYSGGKKDP